MLIDGPSFILIVDSWFWDFDISQFQWRSFVLVLRFFDGTCSKQERKIFLVVFSNSLGCWNEFDLSLLVLLLSFTDLNIALKWAVYSIALIFTSMDTLSSEHPWHWSFPYHFACVNDLLFNDSLLRMPVPFILPKKPLNVIKTSLIKRIAIFPIASLKILICCLIPYD